MANKKWEVFLDFSYYDTWCVRPIGDKKFDSEHSFHLMNFEEAERLKNYLEFNCISDKEYEI